MFNVSVGLVVWAAILAFWNIIMFIRFSFTFIGEVTGLKKTVKQKKWQLPLIKAINALLNLIVLIAVIVFLPGFILNQLIHAGGNLINLLLPVVIIANVTLAFGIYSLRIRDESLKDLQTINVLLFPLSLLNLWKKWPKNKQEESGLDIGHGNVIGSFNDKEFYKKLDKDGNPNYLVLGVAGSRKYRMNEDNNSACYKMVMEVEGDHGLIEHQLADNIKGNWPYPIDPFFTASTKQICTNFIQYIEFIYEKNGKSLTEENIMYELKEMERMIREQELPVNIVLSVLKDRMLANNKMLKFPMLELIGHQAIQKTWDLLSFELQDTEVENQSISLVCLECMDENLEKRSTEYKTQMAKYYSEMDSEL